MRAAPALRSALDRASDALETAGAKCDVRIKPRRVDALTAPFYVRRLEAIHGRFDPAFRAAGRTFETSEALARALERVSRTLGRGLRQVPPQRVPRPVRGVARRYLDAMASHQRITREAAAAYRRGLDPSAEEALLRRLNRSQRRFADACVDFSTML